MYGSNIVKIRGIEFYHVFFFAAKNNTFLEESRNYNCQDGFNFYVDICRIS